jgi:uncharacterized protein DUF3309
MRMVLFVLLILLILGGLPTWPYSHSWGYFPSGILGLVLVVVLLITLLRPAACPPANCIANRIKSHLVWFERMQGNDLFLGVTS